MPSDWPMRRDRARVVVGLPNRGLVYAALIALLLAGLVGNRAFGFKCRTAADLRFRRSEPFLVGLTGFEPATP